MVTRRRKPKPAQPAPAAPPEPSSYSTEQLAALAKANKAWSDSVTDPDDLEAILDIARKICRDAKYVKDGMVFPCGTRRGTSRYCVPPAGGTNSPLRTSKDTVDAINKAAGTSIDWNKIEGEEGGKHLQAYVPWIVEFTPAKVEAPGVGHIYKPTIKLDASGRVRGESSSGVTVASGVDLGATDATELRTSGVSPDLIKKLEPYLGKKRADACKALKEKPLTLTEAEADELNQFAMGKHTEGAKVDYGKAQGQYPKENPGKTLTDFGKLTDGEQTALASRKYHNGNLLPNKVNGPLVNAIGSGAGEDAVRDAYHNRADYNSQYRGRYDTELGWMGIPAQKPKPKEPFKK